MTEFPGGFSKSPAWLCRKGLNWHLQAAALAWTVDSHSLKMHVVFIFHLNSTVLGHSENERDRDVVIKANRSHQRNTDAHAELGEAWRAIEKSHL